MTQCLKWYSSSLTDILLHYFQFIRVNQNLKLFNNFIPQCIHVIFSGCLLQENFKTIVALRSTFYENKENIYE